MCSYRSIGRVSRGASGNGMNIPAGNAPPTSSMDCRVVRDEVVIIIGVCDEDVFTLGTDQADMAIDGGRFQFLGA